MLTLALFASCLLFTFLLFAVGIDTFRPRPVGPHQACLELALRYQTTSDATGDTAALVKIANKQGCDVSHIWRLLDRWDEIPTTSSGASG